MTWSLRNTLFSLRFVPRGLDTGFLVILCIFFQLPNPRIQHQAANKPLDFPMLILEYSSLPFAVNYYNIVKLQQLRFGILDFYELLPCQKE